MHSYHKVVVLSHFSGLAYRLCLQNGEWDTVINVTDCESIELMELNNILNENLDILNNNTNNNTVLFDIKEVESVSRNVSNLTDVSTAIVPNDINATNVIINSLIRYVITSHSKFYVCTVHTVH